MNSFHPHNTDVGAIQSPLHKRGTRRSKVTQPEHESSRNCMQAQHTMLGQGPLAWLP